MNRYTDKYGNERVKVTAEWTAKVITAANSEKSVFLAQIGRLAQRLGYLSVKQFEAANKAVSQ